MTNLDITFKPIDKLTTDIIDKLILHQSIDSLRRAASVSPRMIRMDATDHCPVLFYIKRGKKPNVCDWSIHALVPDVLKFLLKEYADKDPDPDPEPPTPPGPDPSKPTIPSTIIPDQPVMGPDAMVTVDGYNVFVTGAIKWNDTDEPNPGNYVCILIKFGEGMLEAYPNAVVSSLLGTNKITDLMDGDQYLEICYPVFNPGEQFITELIWSDEFKEIIKIKVDKNCVLEKS